MNIVEKRDFIHNHLHFADDILIDELYRKIQSVIKGKTLIVGYEADGRQITANKFLTDLKEAESQIESGDFLTLEELEKETDNW
jgi:hypothetical protein